MKHVAKETFHAIGAALGLLAVLVTAMTVRLIIYTPYLAGVFGK